MSIWSLFKGRSRKGAAADASGGQDGPDIVQSLGALSNRLQSLAADVRKMENHLGFVAAIMARQEMVGVMAEPRLQDPLRLERSGFKVRSQFDEDGIIAEIFRRIGTTSRTFVEFGAGSGEENCTGFLLMQGWRGLWIEGDRALIPKIERSWAREITAGLLTVRNAMVTVDTIDDVISSAGVAGEIDFLAVDIDGNDYHVLERIGAVRPRAICTEYNASIPPEIPWT